MRHFSVNEKKAIERIVNWSSSNQFTLINAYDDIFHRNKVGFDHKTNQLIFYRNIEDDNLLDDLLTVEHEILEKSILIKYLIDNRYIYLIHDDSNQSLSKIDGFVKEGLFPIKKSIDKGISRILYKSINHRVFVSQDLVDLYKSDFKTIEDKTLDEAREQTSLARTQADKARKQVKWAITAVVIALLSSLLEIGSFIKNDTVRIHNNQFNLLLGSIKKSVDEIKNIGDKFDNMSSNIDSLQILLKTKSSDK